MTGPGGQRFLVKDPTVPGEKLRVVSQLPPPGTTAAAGYINNASRGGVAQPRERGTETTTMNVHGNVAEMPPTGGIHSGPSLVPQTRGRPGMARRPAGPQEDALRAA